MDGEVSNAALTTEQEARGYGVLLSQVLISVIGVLTVLLVLVSSFDGCFRSQKKPKKQEHKRLD